MKRYFFWRKKNHNEHYINKPMVVVVPQVQLQNSVFEDEHRGFQWKWKAFVFACSKLEISFIWWKGLGITCINDWCIVWILLILFQKRKNWGWNWRIGAHIEIEALQMLFVIWTHAFFFFSTFVSFKFFQFFF